MALPDLSGIPPVDFKNLQSLRKQPLEEGSLFDKIYPIFRAEAPGLLVEIETGFSAKHIENTYDPMHKLKGSASAMGASRLFELAQAGLQMCKNETVFGETELVAQLTIEVNNYNRTIDALFPEYS